MSDVFTLRPEHFELLATNDMAWIRPGFLTLMLPAKEVVERILKVKIKNDATSRDARAVLDERETALRIILSARGKEVPCGRYRLKEGKWEFEEKTT